MEYSQTFASKFGGSAPHRGWRFSLCGTLRGNQGKLYFDWSKDGTVIESGVYSTVPVNAANGATLWSGSPWTRTTVPHGHTITFYTSTDGVTYTQHRDAVTRAGVTSLHYPATAYEIGTRSTGSESMLTGCKLYEVEIRPAIGHSVNVVPQLPDMWIPQDAALVFGGSPVLFIINAAQGGAHMDYVNDAARWPKLTPPAGTTPGSFTRPTATTTAPNMDAPTSPSGTRSRTTSPPGSLTRR